MEGLFPEVTHANSNAAQILVQTGLYGYVLFVAANMIGDGAELLLLVPSLAPLVGSIVLPILGAVPDGLMVLFSGMGEREDAISQVAVGMGAMAGSSVMLLTMPWFLAVVGGRVSIQNGSPTYVKPSGAGADWAKLTPPGSKGLFSTGVEIRKPVQDNAKLMILTCTTMLVIQIPAWKFDHNEMVKSPPDSWEGGKVPKWFDDQAADELIYAYASLATCAFWFVFYLVKMYLNGCSDKVVVATVEAIKSGQLTIWGALETELTSGKGNSDLGDKLLTTEDPKVKARLNDLLRPFFNRYDEDRSGSISKSEFMVLLSDLRVAASMTEREDLFRQADSNKGGDISFEEFVDCVLLLIYKDFAAKPATNGNQANGKVAVLPGGSTIAKKSHSYVTKDFWKPAWCEGCGSVLTGWSGQGLECKSCSGVLCHTCKQGGVCPGRGGNTPRGPAKVEPQAGDNDVTKEDDEPEDEEEDEMPEDLAQLPPAVQQARIKKRAFAGMAMGTLLVLVFSDPMCDMLGVLGDLANVPKFYVAFVLAPLASNASELIAAMKLASKKTAKSMVDSLSSLTGAAVMNNTFCMSIFLYLVIKQRLAFTFKAEVLSIVAVEVLVGLLALKGSTMRLFEAFIVLSCYPLCLVLVLVLEKKYGLD